MRSHTLEKPYSCEICGKSFSQSSNKNIHLKTHTGEKPYSCEICDKSFSQIGHKNVHMRIHTGKKPYFCGKCGKSFSQLGHRDRHMRIHAGDKPYSCDVSGKSFTTALFRDEHKKAHTNKIIHIQPTMKPVCVKLKKLSSAEIKSLSKVNKEHSLDSICAEETLNKEPEVHNDDSKVLSSRMKLVCVKIKKLACEEIDSLSKVNNEHSLDSINEEDSVYKDPLTFDIQLDNICKVLNVKEETKCISDYLQNNENNDPLNIKKEIKKEEYEEYYLDDPLSFKMESCGSEVHENNDRIDIEEFKLEEPDV